ncbi:hypothetical protein PPERSA_02688 [Pseudocohnilembus persalinus]|uniref:Uncharacterized protein n=1 Tax=Pseudocohnilembus persalinus TaxID=266149 RepID=A0A0V0R6N5_PSEPJ|nr:hypothetical protein PPERSA_02688 [Pseudocohnilembus persalinus]|eukprot:KRX09816.1 hypothetical protein PPERSA_02688 [Pseudocohnilembus persalinus]
MSAKQNDNDEINPNQIWEQNEQNQLNMQIFCLLNQEQQLKQDIKQEQINNLESLVKKRRHSKDYDQNGIQKKIQKKLKTGYEDIITQNISQESLKDCFILINNILAKRNDFVSKKIEQINTYDPQTVTLNQNVDHHAIEQKLINLEKEKPKDDIIRKDLKQKYQKYIQSKKQQDIEKKKQKQQINYAPYQIKNGQSVQEQNINNEQHLYMYDQQIQRQPQLISQQPGMQMMNPQYQQYYIMEPNQEQYYIQNQIQQQQNEAFYSSNNQNLLHQQQNNYQPFDIKNIKQIQESQFTDKYSYIIGKQQESKDEKSQNLLRNYGLQVFKFITSHEQSKKIISKKFQNEKEQQNFIQWISNRKPEKFEQYQCLWNIDNTDVFQNTMTNNNNNNNINQNNSITISNTTNTNNNKETQNQVIILDSDEEKKQDQKSPQKQKQGQQNEQPNNIDNNNKNNNQTEQDQDIILTYKNLYRQLSNLFFQKYAISQVIYSNVKNAVSRRAHFRHISKFLEGISKPDTFKQLKTNKQK